MNTIYLDVAGKMHSLYRELKEYPPDGYQFALGTDRWDKASTQLTRNKSLYSFMNRNIGELLPINLTKSVFERWKTIPKVTDLTYSAGHLVFRREPWVVDFEFVTQLAGYRLRHLKTFKTLIENTLRSDYCKSIICWTEACKNSVVFNLDTKGFEHKIEVVPLAVRKKTFYKVFNDSKVKFIFLGSSNIPGEFELRGGREAVEAFIQLSKLFKNLEFVIRSDVPFDIRNRISQHRNIRLIDKVILWKDLEMEFQTSDIFLLPANSSQDVAVLDAMSYELPVISTDVWANPEWVEHGITGLIVKKNRKAKHYAWNYIPDWSSPFNRMVYRTTDQEVVKELVDKCSILIGDSDLRRKMGKAGRKEIEDGKFSIENRNIKLKKIFDEAIGVS